MTGVRLHAVAVVVVCCSSVEMMVWWIATVVSRQMASSRRKQLNPKAIKGSQTFIYCLISLFVGTHRWCLRWEWKRGKEIETWMRHARHRHHSSAICIAIRHNRHYCRPYPYPTPTRGIFYSLQGKGTLICIALHRTNPWSAKVWITQLLNCKAHHTCLYRVVRQRALRLNEQL